MAKGAREIRQEKILEGVSKGKSLTQAQIDAGIGPSYARTGRIKTTKTWKALMEKHFPDSKLAKKVDELIEHEEWRATDAGLNHAFKLKGKYEPDKHEVKVKRDVGEIEDEIAKTLSEVGGLVSGEKRSD